jgi:hypothetical protein
MDVSQQIQDLSNKTTKLLLDANSIFNNAITLITQQPNAYTADQLTKDVSTLGADWVTVLMSLWPWADPMLPTISIVKPAVALPGSAGVGGSASLARSVDPAVQPTVTNLVFLGLPNAAVPTPALGFPPIPMRNVAPPMPNPTPKFLDGGIRQQIFVEIDGTTIPVPPAPAPQRGIYQGYVLVGDVPVAVVVLRAT